MIKLTKNVFPDFIIVGAQKGGTTSLHYYLNQHPNLRGSVPKELHYFDKNERKSLEWYKSHFKKPIFSSIMFFESTPSYIYQEKIAKEIHSIKPNIKLILCLRNPIDRAFSAWNMYRLLFEKNSSKELKIKGLNLNTYNLLFKDRSTFPSFEECIEIEMSLLNTENIEPAILRRGLYFDQLKSYYKFIPENNIKIIHSKDLLQNTLTELNKITTFLGLSEFNDNNLKLEIKHKIKYNISIKEETRAKLSEFYKESNDKLFALINENYNWD